MTTTVFNEFENMGHDMREVRARATSHPGLRSPNQARRHGSAGNGSFRIRFQGGAGADDFVEILRFFMQNTGVDDVDSMDYEELLARFGHGGAARPADEQAISELPSDEFRSDQTDVEENEQAVCSICLTAFGKGDEISTLPCGHAYHKECIGQWLRNVNNCPICKQSI